MKKSKYNFVIERFYKFLDSDSPFWWGLWFLWRALSLNGKMEEAVEMLKKSFLMIGFNDLVREIERAGFRNAFEVAAESLSEIFKQKYIPPYNIATLFYHAKQLEKALHWIEKAFEERDPGLVFLKVDPEWEQIRAEEYFIGWMKKIGLTDKGRSV